MRRTLSAIVGLVTLVAGAAAPAAAQPPQTTRASAWSPGRVELGGNGSALVSARTHRWRGGPQVTLNLTRHHGLQLSMDLNLDRRGLSWNVEGTYEVLYRHTLSDGPCGRSFLFAGLAGAVQGAHHDAYTYTLPAHGSSVGGVMTEIPATTNSYPSETRWRASLPSIGIAGVGVNARLARWLTLQLQGEVAVTPTAAGGRLAVGLSVPLGRLDR